MQPDLKKLLLQHASSHYAHAGRFDLGWARGKLRHDPIFAALLEQRLLPDGARVVDLGCGRGLLAAWFLAAERMAQRGEWTAAPPPRGLSFRGTELMSREVACGNAALQPIWGERVCLNAGDMRNAELHEADVVAVLDVLHYIPPDDQDRLLDRIRGALRPGGLFITRIGDADGGFAFRCSQFVDRCISYAQGHRLSRMWCRPRGAWVRALEQRGFAVQAMPMSRGTPFANVMLVARVT